MTFGKGGLGMVTKSIVNGFISKNPKIGRIQSLYCIVVYVVGKKK